MNDLPAESRLGDCLICFSKIENYDVLDVLPNQENQKIVENCWNYLHDNIASNKLQHIKLENENEFPICKKCFDAVSELIQHSEILIKSQKQISDLSFEFSLGVLARRTEVGSVNHASDGQNSPKEFILLDVSSISPSLFSKNQPKPTETEDFAHPCENNFIGMDPVNDFQHILEIVKHESNDAFGESVESEDDANSNKNEELQEYTRPVVLLKKLKETKVSEKFNSDTNTPPQQPDVTNLKHGLRNESSKKKIGQSTSSNIIHRKTNTGNLKKVKMSVASRKFLGGVGTGKSEHKCQECEKVFVESGQLKRHIRVHTGERPYKCSICLKNLAKSSSRKAHERIHTGERPFKCSFCMKTFGVLNCLHKHVRIHTGEKPFKCSFCEKAFASSSAKQTHERIHTGEKPYKCSHCTKTFAHLSTLKYHLRVHKRERKL